MSIEADKNTTSPQHFVETRLIRLHRLKTEDDLVVRQREWKMKNKVKRVFEASDDRSDYITDLAFTVKNTKDAELLAGMPEYNFIPLDDESRKKVRILKHIWMYWWLVSNTDKVLSKVVPSATAYGTGIMYEGLKTIVKDIKEPFYDKDGKIDFREKRVVDYDGVYCEYIPWENFWIDGTDMDNATEAIWIKYWDRQEYINEYKNNPLYKNISDEIIPPHKLYTIITGVDDPKKDTETDEIITEMRYYNKSRDEMIILANGKEVYNTPIPFAHKELPFCPYLDYRVDSRFWGMGEYELLEEDELFADALRSLDIDVVRAQMGVVMVEDDLDMDEAQFEYGTNTFVRVDDVSKVKHFAPNISTNSLSNSEVKLDNTIISKTGVNHRSQTLDPSETATKTAAKGQSAKKRLNMNLKINGYYFFQRLARLRLSNLKLFHSRGTKEIFIEGGNISNSGSFEPVNGGYGSFTVTPEFLEGEYSIVPITESILGSSEERAKAKFLEFVQIMSPLVGADGKPVLKGEKLVEKGAEIWGFDIDKLTANVEAERNPEDIVKQAMKENQGVSTDSTDPSSPEFIPGEQKSGAAAKGLSGAAAVKDIDILE